MILEKGTYTCKQCFHSFAKFDSGCSWPSFDAERDIQKDLKETAL
ncbi:MAG: peptide-methionine (R)-S-oxide reductase [Dysgonamonadaceae bacterium]|nr:peptide-methionine (R)-S-oxide reductase [Dysgonamonadaceae bacterium]